MNKLSRKQLELLCNRLQRLTDRGQFFIDVENKPIQFRFKTMKNKETTKAAIVIEVKVDESLLPPSVA